MKSLLFIKHAKKTALVGPKQRMDDLTRDNYSKMKHLKGESTPQTSHNIDCALGPLCYIRACSI
jgi:hypothetical protein